MNLDPKIGRHRLALPAPERMAVRHADVAGQEAAVRVAKHDAFVSSRLIPPADLIGLAEAVTVALPTTSAVVVDFVSGDDALTRGLSTAGDKHNSLVARHLAAGADQLGNRDR